MTQGLHPLARIAGNAGPGAWRLAGNLWPPLLFAGVRVERIAADFRHVRIRLAKSPLTANMFGTQFGGSMFAMTDPFWVMMLTRNLGPGYTVWDRRAEIEFVKPGRTVLTAEFVLSEAEVEEIRAEAESGGKVLRWFDTEIRDRDGAVVARVRKQVYVRRRKPSERQ
ncbi:MAG: DUF4442 domain-containing protein [Streptosporangiales bacterium]|nr:DUF4442 domain-containing protein [Streptosporangiales bacterium]